jgi:hypothetical protein
MMSQVSASLIETTAIDRNVAWRRWEHFIPPIFWFTGQRPVGSYTSQTNIHWASYTSMRRTPNGYSIWSTNISQATKLPSFAC